MSPVGHPEVSVKFSELSPTRVPNWRNGIIVPRPRTWEERRDLIGKTVIPHTCEAREHGDNEGCICDLIGKPVVITKIYKMLPFVGTSSYHIKGSQKRIMGDAVAFDQLTL